MWTIVQNRHISRKAGAEWKHMAEISDSLKRRNSVKSRICHGICIKTDCLLKFTVKSNGIFAVKQSIHSLAGTIDCVKSLI